MRSTIDSRKFYFCPSRTFVPCFAPVGRLRFSRCHDFTSFRDDPLVGPQVPIALNKLPMAWIIGRYLLDEYEQGRR